MICDKCRNRTNRLITSGGKLVCGNCHVKTRSSGNFWRQWVFSEGAGCWPHEIARSKAYCDKMGFHAKFRPDGSVGFNDHDERLKYLDHYELQEK